MWNIVGTGVVCPNPTANVRVHRTKPFPDKVPPFGELLLEPGASHLVCNDGCVKLQMVRANATTSPRRTQHVLQHLLEHVAKWLSLGERKLVVKSVFCTRAGLDHEPIWPHDAGLGLRLFA